PPTGGAVLEDRIGTGDTTLTRPYGENGGHFATYQQDSFTTLHYAQQRYYASAYGRFTIADRMNASASGGNPQSWNRYAYVGGDPINRSDPRGTCWVNNGNQVEDARVTDQDAMAGYGYQHYDGSCNGSDPVFSVTTTASAPSDPEPEPDPCQQSDAGCAPTSTVAYTPPPPAISDGGGVPVSKSYETGVIPCSESASQVIGSIEGNFAAFGNFQTQAL